MRTNLALSLGLGLVVAGCGSSHGRDGVDGSARRDAGAGRDAGIGRDAGVPDECRVDTTVAPPYPTVLRFENDTMETLFIGEDCTYRFTVRACASGWEPVSLYAGCTVPCPVPDMGCIWCGACMVRAVTVAAGEAVDVSWDGVAYTFDSTMGCRCSNAMNAPAGRYSVEVPVYDSAMAAQSGGAPVRMVQVGFSLPAPDGVVRISLGGG